MKHKLSIPKITVLLLSFMVTATGVFAQENVITVREDRTGLETIEDYFTDETRVKPLLALKTNLLFDVLATPNIELEIPFDKNFSMMAEYWFPWWLDEYTGDCYQLLYGGIEARYWFRYAHDRDVFRGHFMGLYAGFGLYDLGRKDGGFRGDIDFYAGLTYGYSFKLNKFLRLETSLGLGVLQTKYDRYILAEKLNVPLWQHSGVYTYFGPSKLKVSLVVLFHGKDKNKK